MCLSPWTRRSRLVCLERWPTTKSSRPRRGNTNSPLRGKSMNWASWNNVSPWCGRMCKPTPLHKASAYNMADLGITEACFGDLCRRKSESLLTCVNYWWRVSICVDNLLSRPTLDINTTGGVRTRSQALLRFAGHQLVTFTCLCV